MRLYAAMVLSESGDDRWDIMATTIQQMHPVAHVMPKDLYWNCTW